MPAATGLLDWLADAALIFDEAGMLLSANAPAERLFGFSEGELAGCGLDRLLARPLDGRAIRRLLPGLLRRCRRGRLVERLCRRRDGSGFRVEASLSRMPGDGSAAAILAVVRPLCRRTTLEREQRKFESAVEQSPVGILITRADGTIEYANPHFCRVTGWERAEILGRTPRFLQSGLTPRATYAQLWHTVRSGGVWHGLLRNRRKDGGIYWTENRIAPIRDAAGTITHIVAIEDDVTEAHEREEELQRAKLEAEVANRTKSEFLASFSHELRTPLNAIIGFSQLIAEEAFGPVGNARYAGYAADILHSGQHLLTLIDDIMDISRIELGRSPLSESLFDPADQIRLCLRMIEPRLRQAGIALELDLPSDLPRLRADQGRFRQVLLNLLSNAAKFTQPHGKVGVSAAVAAAGPERRPVLEIVVRDSGIGMTEAEIGIALTPYAQVENPMSRRYGGAGLGLPIANGLMEQHGGTLSVASHRGEGTSVTLRFPGERLDDRQGGGA